MTHALKRRVVVPYAVLTRSAGTLSGIVKQADLKR